MPLNTYQSSRRFKPFHIVMSPGERRRIAFFTDPWGSSTPSSPVLTVYDSEGVDVTSTYTSDTYSLSGDSESEVVGANVIWTRYITGLIDGQNYSYTVDFTMGGNDFTAYGEISCQQFGHRLNQVKEGGLYQGDSEKLRYQLDSRSWRLSDELATALSLGTTVSSPVLSIYDLDGVDVTSSTTTDESGTAPDEVSGYWVRTKFIQNLNPQEYRFIIKFVLQRNTYEAWGRLYGED